MTQPLFRKEVVAARQYAHFGSIRIARNITFEAVAAACLTFVGLISALAIWGHVPRKTHATGIVVPNHGMVEITSTAAGSILEATTAEGVEVHAGDVLFVIDIDRVGLAGGTSDLVQLQLKEREISLSAERQSRLENERHMDAALRNRLKAAAREEEIAVQEVANARQRRDLLENSVKRYEALAKDGFISSFQLDRQHQDLHDAEAQFRSAERTLASIRRDIIGTRDELNAAPITLKTELAQIDRNLAMLSQEAVENQARRRSVIVAPQDGTLTARHLSAGASVQVGQSLATLVPHARTHEDRDVLNAEIYAPSRAVGLVHEGQKVWLRFSAFPYEKFGMGQGVVTGVSQTPVNPQDLPTGQAQALLQAAQTNEPLFRVKVQLAQQHLQAFGHDVPLKPGMTVDADIVQEQRALWEWMLEPLLAARGLSFSH